MSWRVILTEKGKNDYTPVQHLKLVAKDKGKIGSQLIDWMCRNGFITVGQLAGEALLRDLSAFKKANGTKEINISIKLVNKSEEKRTENGIKNA